MEKPEAIKFHSGSEHSLSAKEIINPILEREHFIESLYEKLKDATIEQKTDVVSILFKNSVEDGMTLSKKLGLNTTATFQSLMDSADREDRLIEQITSSVSREVDNMSDTNRILFETELSDYERRKDDQSIRKRVIQKETEDEIQEYYLPFIAQKRVQEKIGISSSLADESLVQLFTTRERIRGNLFPFFTIADYIKKETGKELEWGGERTLTEKEAIVVLEKYGLDLENAKASKRINPMPVYKEIYDAQKDNAKLELKKEIRESLISRGYSEGDFEIFKKGTKYVIEFSDDIEKKETFSDYQKKKVAAIEKELLKEGVDKYSIAQGLAGVSTPESIELRERLLKEGLSP